MIFLFFFFTGAKVYLQLGGFGVTGDEEQCHLIALVFLTVDFVTHMYE